MTPDDKRRLAGFYMIRMTPESEIEPAQWSQAMRCWFTCGSEERVSGNLVHEVVCNLDEATAEASYWRKEAHREWDANNLAEVIAERDAAMAALRRATDALKSYAFGSLARHVAEQCDRVLAAHSAATKPTEEVSG